MCNNRVCYFLLLHIYRLLLHIITNLLCVITYYYISVFCYYILLRIITIITIITCYRPKTGRQTLSDVLFSGEVSNRP